MSYANGGFIGFNPSFNDIDNHVISTQQTLATIQYVGGATVSGAVLAAGSRTVSLTGLTGGLASSPSAGDIVIVYITVASNRTTGITIGTTGYTYLSTSQSALGTNYTISRGAYKIMGSTPDTALTVSTSETSTTRSVAIAVQVWRNVDTTTPLDTTTQFSTGTTSVRADPPAITPSTNNAVIIAMGGGAHTAGTATYSSSDLSNFRTIGFNNTFDATVGMGSYQWTSGAFNPAQFTFSTTDSTAYSYTAATLALRPAPTTIVTYGNRKNSGVWDLTSAKSAASERLGNLYFNDGLITGASYTGFLDLYGFSITGDGNKLVYPRYTANTLSSYQLSTPWSVVNINTTPTATITTLQGLDCKFDPSGTKMHVASFNKFIYQYALTTPWDISTASQTSFYNTGYALYTIHFIPSGLAAYLLTGNVTAGGGVNQWAILKITLTTPWDISTVTNLAAGLSYAIPTGDGPLQSLSFNTTGTKMFILTSSARVYQYDLSTPYVYTTSMIPTRNFYYTEYIGSPIQGGYVDASGQRFFMSTGRPTGSAINQYQLGGYK